MQTSDVSDRRSMEELDKVCCIRGYHVYKKEVIRSGIVDLIERAQQLM